MIKQFLKIIVLTLFSPIALATPQIGELAPNFTATDIQGNTVQLSELKNNLVVLEWTNHDCPFVRKHYDGGNMQMLQKKFTEQGVVWISIISSAPGKQGHVDPAQALALTTSRDAAPTHVVLDPSGDIGKQYEAKTTPHLFIIDKSGLIAYMGAIDSIRSTDKDDIPKATNYVDIALSQMMAGEAITTTETRPYGCSVKY